MCNGGQVLVRLCVCKCLNLVSAIVKLRFLVNQLIFQECVCVCVCVCVLSKRVVLLCIEDQLKLSLVV